MRTHFSWQWRTRVVALCAMLVAHSLVGCHYSALRRGDPNVKPSVILDAAESSDESLAAGLIQYLERWVSGTRSDELRHQVLAACVAVGDRVDLEAEPFLIELAGDEDESIRAQAVEALGAFETEASWATLRRVAAEDRSLRVRRRAAAGLAPDLFRDR